MGSVSGVSCLADVFTVNRAESRGDRVLRVASAGFPVDCCVAVLKFQGCVSSSCGCCTFLSSLLLLDVALAFLCSSIAHASDVSRRIRGHGDEDVVTSAGALAVIMAAYRLFP